MTTPFVSSLRVSMGASPSCATISAPSKDKQDKNAMLSLFSELDLALDASGTVTSNSSSSAKALLASKQAEKQQEAALAAAQAQKKQQQQQQKPETALSQAMGLFDQELEQRDSFVSRKQRKRRGASARGRRQRVSKYQHV